MIQRPRQVGASLCRWTLFGLMLTSVLFLSSCGPSDGAKPQSEIAKPSEAQRVPVTSSNLQSVGYDTASRILTIEFRNGSVYQFAEVPPEVHAELTNAKSHGKYFHSRIRNAGFTSNRVH